MNKSPDQLKIDEIFYCDKCNNVLKYFGIYLNTKGRFKRFICVNCTKLAGTIMIKRTIPT